MDVIKVNNLSKKFRTYHEKPALINIWKKKRYEEFPALRDVNFSVSQGETIGIIGRNGSGKSTLLKILCGVMAPTSGSVETNGSIASLLELGAGFHPELTGRENIFLNASIMNLSTKEVKNKFDEIVSFAQLEDFIDTPLYTYSSGMYVRLGFAIAVFTNFDILIIDEILAVGDAGFQEKCADKIMGFKNAGKTIIFVTHDLGMADKISDKILWLENGKLKKEKGKRYIIDSYLELFSKEKKQDISKKQQNFKNEKNIPIGLEPDYQKQYKRKKLSVDSISKGIVITKVKIMDEKKRIRKTYAPKSKLIIEMQYKAKKNIKNPIFGVGIFSKEGTLLMGPNTKSDKFNIPEINGTGKIFYTIDSLPILQGEYFIDVSITDSSCVNQFDYHHKKYQINIKNHNDASYGQIIAKGKWRIQKNK